MIRCFPNNIPVISDATVPVYLRRGQQREIPLGGLTMAFKKEL
jgi:hypothetical protein